MQINSSLCTNVKQNILIHDTVCFWIHRASLIGKTKIYKSGPSLQYDVANRETGRLASYFEDFIRVLVSHRITSHGASPPTTAAGSSSVTSNDATYIYIYIYE